MRWNSQQRLRLDFKELLNKQMLAGKLAVSRDGTGAHGSSVRSGLYFAMIKQDNTHRVHKMLLMK